MPKEKLGIRDVLAHNLRENRRKCGLTQEKLSEKAGISAHYLAMVEVSRKFPTPEMLERLAKSLDVEPHELFTVPPTPQDELEKIRQDIRQDIKQDFKQEIIDEVVKIIKQTLIDECNK